MSAPENGHEPAESRSSVKLTRNAKGDTQIEVKVYVGDSDDDLEHARQKAVDVYNQLRTEYA